MYEAALSIRILVAMERDLSASDPLLASMVERLVREFAPDRIHLFGSRARGEQGVDSDYDLLVLVSNPTEPGYRLAQRGRRCLGDLPIAADVLVWPTEAFDRRVHLEASLPATVLREGVRLHAA